MRKKIFMSVIILFFVFLGSTTIAQEEYVSATGLQISPIRLDWRVEDSERRKGLINVKNYSEQKKNVSVSVENFFVSPDSEHTNLFGGDKNHPRHAFNVIDWFEVPENFILSPGESKDVSFFVNVPQDQPTSGYYGSVLFQTTNRDTETIDDNKNTEIGVNYRIGAIVTLAVQGEGDPFFSGVIDLFKSTKEIYWDEPIQLDLVLKNTGNLHYKESGEIEITQFGRKYRTVKLDSHVMYPDAERIISKKIDYGIWDFGKYEARLRIDVENDDIEFPEEITIFYVIPWKGVLSVGVGLSMLLLVIFVVPRYISVTWKEDKKK